MVQYLQCNGQDVDARGHWGGDNRLVVVGLDIQHCIGGVCPPILPGKVPAVPYEEAICC